MWEDVLEHVADGVVVADSSGLVRFLNPAAERLLGRSSPRAVDHPLSELVGEELSRLVSRALESNSPVAQDGVLLNATPVDALAAPAKNGVVITLRDRTLSQRVADEEKLTDRLHALGTVAAGIAHEVKNPLGGIRGAAQLLARKAPAEDREYLDVIVREVDRIATLVDRLRDLSQAEISQTRGPVDLNRLVHELVLLQKTTREVKIDLDLDPSLPTVDGDADLLKRMALNVLRNAIEAAKAKIRLVTRVETGRRWRDPLGQPHALVTLSIEDDGAGVAPQDRERLFEPFFTTKPKGTGLGLATAQRIAHDHSGTLTLEPGTPGARFLITLPASLAGADA